MSTRGLTWDIYVVPLAGGEWIRLTQLPSFIQSHSPTWSPDGAQIAYASERSGNFDIHRIPAGGGENTQVTFDTGWDTAPAWSPDGDRIAFASNRSGVFEIWIQVLE